MYVADTRAARRSRTTRPGPSSSCRARRPDRKSTRLNSSHLGISYAVFCLKKITHKSLSLRALRDFFFNDTATTEIYTLSLHDALPISEGPEPPDRVRHHLAEREG